MRSKTGLVRRRDGGIRYRDPDSGAFNMGATPGILQLLSTHHISQYDNLPALPFIVNFGLC